MQEEVAEAREFLNKENSEYRDIEEEKLGIKLN